MLRTALRSTASAPSKIHGKNRAEPRIPTALAVALPKDSNSSTLNELSMTGKQRASSSSRCDPRRTARASRLSASSAPSSSVGRRGAAGGRRGRVRLERVRGLRVRRAPQGARLRGQAHLSGSSSKGSDRAPLRGRSVASGVVFDPGDRTGER
jgi:hypothetical protein